MLFLALWLIVVALLLYLGDEAEDHRLPLAFSRDVPAAEPVYATLLRLKLVSSWLGVE